MANRTIPLGISNAVKKRDYFECAWCGTRLYDRHHIVEFADGGQHTVSNLILLCPNCHRQVHSGMINQDELVLRQSTHVKGDRIAGNIQFESPSRIVRIGASTFFVTPVLIQYGDQPIIELREVDGAFLLSARFYDEEGNLIFWMSDNRYWTTVDFKVAFDQHELIIADRSDNAIQLRIWEADGEIHLQGRGYLGTMPIEFTPHSMTFGNTIFRTLSSAYNRVGILIRRREQAMFEGTD